MGEAQTSQKRCPNVRTERRSGKPLTVETMTDRNGARFDLCLLDDRATVALAINFHTFLPQIPRCGERMMRFGATMWFTACAAKAWGGW
jgi:hypothetical protein